MWLPIGQNGRPGDRLTQGEVLLFGGVLATLWTFVILIAVHVSSREQKTIAERFAHNMAITSYQRDLLFRRWAAGHGGVYVPATEATPPNPLLADVPERDIFTPSGKKLTLMNPAYMLRQLYSLTTPQDLAAGKITSTKPLSAANEPTEWERGVLKEFERGLFEKTSRESSNGADTFHLARGMKTEASCVGCHGKQGYKVGDVRGAIHISVDMRPYVEAAEAKNRSDLVRYILIWLVGMFVIGLGSWRMVTLTRALVKAKEQAQESDRLKSTFLANISHEIRTPMNGILGFADLLKMTELAPLKRNEYLDIIVASGEKMLRILNDLIDISKIEAGVVSVETQNVALLPKLEGILKFFQIAAAERGIALNLESDVPELSIATDSTKLDQILSDLIRNAIQHTENGAILFGYSVRGETVEFYVADTGKGICATDQARIFDRFFSAQCKEKSGVNGAGLGLAITRSYVELLGGKIWFLSEENRGTTFRFTLPLR